MKIQQIKLSELSLLDNNPRSITDDNFKKLKRDIEKDPEFLERRPLLVNKTKDKLTVYAGNMRLRALKDLGKETAPCIVDENLSQELINERALRDNVEYGQWDWDILANEWDIDLKKFDLPELDIKGFTDDDNEYKNKDITNTFENMEFDHKCPRCKFGFND